MAFERVLRIGDPVHEIVRFAGEWRADLVAMGRHGHSALSAVIVGSVTQKVIAMSPVPVLLVEQAEGGNTISGAGVSPR